MRASIRPISDLSPIGVKTELVIISQWFRLPAYATQSPGNVKTLTMDNVGVGYRVDALVHLGAYPHGGLYSVVGLRFLGHLIEGQDVALWILEPGALELA